MASNILGTFTFVVDNGYMAMRSGHSAPKAATWRSDCSLVAEAIGIPVEQHPGLFAWRYAVYHCIIGTRNPFSLLGRRVAIWAVQNTMANGGPDYSGSLVLTMARSNGVVLNARLETCNLTTEISKELVRRRARLGEHTRMQEAVGTELFSQVWTSWITRAHLMIALIKSATVGST